MEITKTRTYKLDNAANLFPSIAKDSDSHVYRITAILKEKIVRRLLQEALEDSLSCFDAFRVRICRGRYWYYLETNEENPSVCLESEVPCRFVTGEENQGFLFRVLYFGNRIHLEMFHVLSDGTGAFEFLKAICYRYIQKAYEDRLGHKAVDSIYGTSYTKNMEDGYLKNYVADKVRSFDEKKPYKLKGISRENENLGILTVLMPVSNLKENSYRNGVTISEYLTAVFAYSILRSCDVKENNREHVNILVPVNLRPVFETETIHNFFTSIMVSIPGAMRDATFAEVIREVKKQFTEKKTKKALQEKIAYTVAGEKNVMARIAPLPIKDRFLKMMYRRFGSTGTIAFSNMGNIKVESEFEEYIEGFRILLPLGEKEPLKISACTYHGEVAMTFTSLFRGNNIARDVVWQLREAGMPITLETGNE